MVHTYVVYRYVRVRSVCPTRVQRTYYYGYRWTEHKFVTVSRCRVLKKKSAVIARVDKIYCVTHTPAPTPVVCFLFTIRDGSA